MNHNHNGAQPESYSNVEPYYSEFNRMLRIPASPPSTKEKIKWAESHLETLSLTKPAPDGSPRIPTRDKVPVYTVPPTQDDIEMQVDQGTENGGYSNHSLPPTIDSIHAGLEDGPGFHEGQLAAETEMDSMDVDAIDGSDGDGCSGRKRKADGDVDDRPLCKRK
ncbi:hypothetical protein L218DRAFT_241034 [Marasmius fiardii PR-910]|nr:hypothetical protein L218DRAFT_241034 [Marasmius fiardii PR-910]